MKNLTGSFDSFKNKKIFLTGGTGFFGKNLLAFFAYLNREQNANLKISVLSRNSGQFEAKFPNVEFVRGDVRDFKFPDGKYDFVIHAATPASAQLEAENPDEMRSIIIEGTKHVVKFAKKCGADKLLLTSSGAIYGTQPPEIKNISEDYPPRPVSAYGAGKLEAEKICSGEFGGSVIARCFALVGPHLPLDIHYAIGNFIRDGLAGNKITVEGDGRAYRSYLYSEELVIWLITILLNGEHGRAYNVGSEHEISIGDLANLVSERFARKIPVKIMGAADESIPAPRYVPSTARAREEFGLSQKISLEESIDRTIEWYRANS